MKSQILIAHALGEDEIAEKLATPLREAGYDVLHRGTVIVGESVIEETSKALSAGAPVVLCGTVKATGTKWARRVVNAAHQYSGVRVFVVQVEEEADVESIAFDYTIARYWQDPQKAMQDLISALQKYYPLEDTAHVLLSHDVEQRYRELALESCDIIDLANLPESDRHIATRHLELRRLYVPLRVRVEIQPHDELAEIDLEALEKRRESERRRAALWGIPTGSGIEEDTGRFPIGQRLGEARRLVVLGDPGAGKTTMLRWIATAYLLRLKRDPDFKDLPDVATLPEEDWLPIIVRCRDLDQACLSGSLDDILHYTLRRAEMTDIESATLRIIFRDKLKNGKALLLIDGLDEISNSASRAKFCQHLESIHIAYPNTPIVATSRIVGYREMGYRIGRGFEHLTIADLSRKEKDNFARRWCALTELPERKETATKELIRDIHSTDRIERLTVNPLLLTTMALVKRKIGKLPSRRTDLYWNAVDVLLNWRREVDEPIDDREAIPQLEYIAYEMCNRGVQQLREDEIVNLFECMREEYPRIHAVRNHSAEDFLHLLERRTGILIQAGHVRHLGMSIPVYEFRHLTFQEYLAARALLDGRFPNRDQSRSLAENIAPLAGQVVEVENRLGNMFGKEALVTENWREVIRLCAVSCKDDDVDSVLQAIVTPQGDEGKERTALARAVLAAECLADEPNVSKEMSDVVLQAFVRLGPTGGLINWALSSVITVAGTLADTRWGEPLVSVVLARLRQEDDGDFEDLCFFGSNIAWGVLNKTNLQPQDTFSELVSKTQSGDEKTVVTAVLALVGPAMYSVKIQLSPPDVVKALWAVFAQGVLQARVAAWALHIVFLLGRLRETRNSRAKVIRNLESVQIYTLLSDTSFDRIAKRY